MTVINVDIGASRRLRVIFFVSIVFALLCLVVSGLPDHWLVFALIVLSVIVWRTWRRTIGSRRCIGIQRESSGQWRLAYEDGTSLNARLLPVQSHVQNCVVILCFRIEGRFMRQYVAIFRDAVDSESFRRLRVYLRWYVLAD